MGCVFSAFATANTKSLRQQGQEGANQAGFHCLVMLSELEGFHISTTPGPYTPHLSHMNRP